MQAAMFLDRYARPKQSRG